MYRYPAIDFSAAWFHVNTPRRKLLELSHDWSIDACARARSINNEICLIRSDLAGPAINHSMRCIDNYSILIARWICELYRKYSSLWASGESDVFFLSHRCVLVSISRGQYADASNNSRDFSTRFRMNEHDSDLGRRRAIESDGNHIIPTRGTFITLFQSSMTQESYCTVPTSRELSATL
jgi:hypothetical protein